MASLQAGWMVIMNDIMLADMPEGMVTRLQSFWLAWLMSCF
jgi:hypothetical protein